MLIAVGVQGVQKGADFVHAQKVPYGTELRKREIVPNGPLRANGCAASIRAAMTDFRDALLWHMSQHKTKIAELARGSGVSADTIKKLRTRKHSSTNAEAADRIAAYYGKSVRDFMLCQDVPDTSAFLALADLLKPEERKMLLAQMRAMIQTREE